MRFKIIIDIENCVALEQTLLNMNDQENCIEIQLYFLQRLDEFVHYFILRNNFSSHCLLGIFFLCYNTVVIDWMYTLVFLFQLFMANRLVVKRWTYIINWRPSELVKIGKKIRWYSWVYCILFFSIIIRALVIKS